ncbi:MAG TPA: sugar transferase [Chthonomonadaceae bacterium]|nr:sugar transferase [Chthonomonadaceae bacterium]
MDPEILPVRKAAEPLPQATAVVRQAAAKPARNPDSIENDAIPSAQPPAPEAQHDPTRFAARYVHPGFSCKEAPYLRVKRALDVLLAIGLLSIAWPAMLAAVIAVRLTSNGPVVFRQVRVGRGGRYFVCYKFRSMCADAEAKKSALHHLNEMDGPVFKIKRDPRITPVGAFIRKYSIDELPQLFNVLRGEMSIVGPRPPVPAEVEKYGPRERQRLAVQPGLTCLWQVSGRSNVAFDRWVELDLRYIKTMSFWNDVRIVLKTIPAVLSGTGAH